MRSYRQPALSILLTLLFCLSASSLAQLIPYGSQQFLELTNKVSIADLKHSHGEETSFTFAAQLKVNSVWHSGEEQLLQIYLNEPTVRAPGKGHKLVERDISTLPDRPFYVSLAIDGRRPPKVIAHTSRDQSLLNLERGVASLLHLRQSDSGPVSEVDVSGQCSVFYSLKSSTKLEKKKTDCSHWDLRVNYRAEKPLGVLQNSKERVLYDLTAEGHLMRAESVEVHSVALAAKPDVGSQVTTQFMLKHTTFGDLAVEQLSHDTLEEAIGSLLDWYRVFDIEADVDGAVSEIKDVTLKQRVTALADHLRDDLIGRESLALTIAELLPLARITKQSEFVEILKAHKDILSQLVDLLGSVQTIDSHAAINDVFSYDKTSDGDWLEKYLQALAVGTHPERAIIEDLMHRLQDAEKPIRNVKLRDSVVQTVAALTKQSNFDPNDPLLQQVRSFVLDSMTGCGEDVDCQTLYLRALQNLQDAGAIPALLAAAVEGDAKVSVAAMQALKNFPIVYFNDSHRQTFTEIFHQRKRRYDSSVRTLALDILFAMKPSKPQLEDLIDYLTSNDNQFEVKTFVLQKLRMMEGKCPRFASLLRDCLKERPHANNYHILGQKGLTTVLSRQLTWEPFFNESLLSVQEIYKGVLKRGSVELILSAGREETSVFKLGIYTSGLTSFVGDSDDASYDDDDSDDSPASAGMEIGVQGVNLRPLVFFTGQSELMGHVWSGTASDPTPAFQATTLAHDHEQYVILASGVTVYVRVVGMRSVDLNGKVNFSLWNRNAQTEIQQNSASAVIGYMAAGFSYGKLENYVHLTSEPKLSLQADLDFYSGVKLCMQLQRPEVSLTHSSTQSIKLNTAKKYSKLSRSKITHKSPGRTLALNQKNNEMCNMILDN